MEVLRCATQPTTLLQLTSVTLGILSWVITSEHVWQMVTGLAGNLVVLVSCIRSLV